MPGGIVDRGGHTGTAGMRPAATLTRGAAYDVLCYDQAEANRRSELSAQERSRLGPPVNPVAPEDYAGSCAIEGAASVFFLLNVWPVTPPLNPEYAISQAVQRLEGDTMIRIETWHETHYYSLLGRVRVFKVRGDVIRYRR